MQMNFNKVSTQPRSALQTACCKRLSLCQIQLCCVNNASSTIFMLSFTCLLDKTWNVTVKHRIRAIICSISSNSFLSIKTTFYSYYVVPMYQCIWQPFFVNCTSKLFPPMILFNLKSSASACRIW